MLQVQLWTPHSLNSSINPLITIPLLTLQGAVPAVPALFVLVMSYLSWS